MKNITKKAWSRVHLKALDACNAAMRDDFIMVGVYKEQLLDLLEELEAEFGVLPAILATRADYVDDKAESRRLFEAALALARAQDDQEEVAEILDSIEMLDDEEKEQE